MTPANAWLPTKGGVEGSVAQLTLTQRVSLRLADGRGCLSAEAARRRQAKIVCSLGSWEKDDIVGSILQHVDLQIDFRSTCTLAPKRFSTTSVIYFREVR